MTLNFPTSIYTNSDAETALGNNTVLTPNDGDTITIGSYGYTFDDDRMGSGANDGRWVMNNGSTYSLTGGATYTWDLYKWKASNIPDNSNVVQTTDTPNNGEVLKWDNGAAVWAADNDTNTTYSAFTGATASDSGSSGLVPAPASTNYNTAYLRADGTWQVPPDTDTNTTYSAFTGADANNAGSAGLVPAPASTNYNTAYLRADGTWQVPPDTDTTYSTANSTTAGVFKVVDEDNMSSNAADAVPTQQSVKKYVDDNTGSGGGLTEFTEADSETTPNNAIHVSSLTSNAGSTNADVAIVPKGTGAFLASIPDGATTGGSKRGTNAVDLQTNRNNAIQVASGNNSVIVGGYGNKATNAYSGILGGQLNSVTAQYGLICNGKSNEALGHYSTIIGGYSQNIFSTVGSYALLGNGNNNHIVGGAYNAVTNGYENKINFTNAALALDYNFIATGKQNRIEDTSYSFIGTGYQNVIDDVCEYTSILNGNGNKAKEPYQDILGGHKRLGGSVRGSTVFGGDYPGWSVDGAAQRRLLTVTAQVQNTNANVFSTNSNYTPSATQPQYAFDIPANSAFHIKGTLVATSIVNHYTGAFDFSCVVKRGSSGNASVVGTPVINLIAADSQAADWEIDISVDTSINALQITLEAANQSTLNNGSAENIYCNCSIDSTEVRTA